MLTHAKRIRAPGSSSRVSRYFVSDPRQLLSHGMARYKNASGGKALHIAPFFQSMSYQYPYTQGDLSMTPTPPTPYAWETVELNNDIPEQLEHPQHVLNPQHKEVYSTSPRMIELQEHVPIIPSQRAHSEVPHHLRHLLSAPGTSTRGASVMSQEMVQRPHIHVDTTRHMSASGSPPSGPPSASGVHSVGPARAKVSPAHNVAAHPYRRPHSANPRRDNESTLGVRQSSSSYAAGPSHMPAPPTIPTPVASMHR